MLEERQEERLEELEERDRAPLPPAAPAPAPAPAALTASPPTAASGQEGGSPRTKRDECGAVEANLSVMPPDVGAQAGAAAQRFRPALPLDDGGALGADDW